MNITDILTPDVTAALTAIFEFFFTLGSGGIVQTILGLFVQLLGIGL